MDKEAEAAIIGDFVPVDLIEVGHTDVTTLYLVTLT